MSEAVVTVGRHAAVRSKNAGPFRLTVDLFCNDEAAYAALRDGLDVARVAEAFAVPAASVRHYELPEIGVIKLSLPRPIAQGAADDRDMHGAQWAVLVEGIALEA